VPAGTKAACIAGACTFSCTTAGFQFCSYLSSQACQSATWGFEPKVAEVFWSNDENVSSSLSTLNPHAGSVGSLEVTASSVPGTRAFVSVAPCLDPNTFEIGTMSLAGRTYTASIFVPALAGNFGATSCQLAYDDLSFAEFVVAQVAPIVPGNYFTMTGTFPAGLAPISRIFISCTLPPTWALDNPAQRWYIDDVSIK
jgi:hypothetical protein